MTALVAIAYILASGILFWHSADDPDRRPLHRAMLYAFAFSLMCQGSARFLIVFGTPASEWTWMLDLGHLSMIAFAAMWIRREVDVNALLKGRRA